MHETSHYGVADRQVPIDSGFKENLAVSGFAASGASRGDNHVAETACNGDGVSGQNLSGDSRREGLPISGYLFVRSE